MLLPCTGQLHGYCQMRFIAKLPQLSTADANANVNEAAFAHISAVCLSWQA